MQTTDQAGDGPRSSEGLGPLPKEECLWGEESVYGYSAEAMEAERQRCYALGVAAERDRCAKLRTVASQVLRDMQAQDVLPEWQALLDEALRA